MADLPIWQTPLREGCFMIGHRNPDTLLQCNTYLRTFGGGSEAAHWCVDPGSQIDYPHVRDHLLEHIGEMKALKMFSINHQDPDVVGNLTFLTQENPKLAGLTTQDVWRLVRHLDVHPRHLYFAEQAQKNLVRLPGGQSIRLVPTPFCHFRGAVAFYDPESRILFSGDLFGGLNFPGRVHLYAEETDWAGIAQFHQIYMPTTAAVARAIRTIRDLRPRVEIIAPQHGFVLTGSFMNEVLDRLEALPVGLDLMEADSDDRFVAVYGEVVSDLVHAVSMHLGRFEVITRLRHLPEDHELREFIHLYGSEVRLDRKGARALTLLLQELGKGLARPVRAGLTSRVLDLCTKRGVPLPQVAVGVEDTGEWGPID